MSIRFASAGSFGCSSLAGVLVASRTPEAANDTEPGYGRDEMLRLALRHFAEHGLAAADRAREQAEAAFFAGDRDHYDHWMAICRTLDRRMAANVSRRIARRLG